MTLKQRVSELKDALISKLNSLKSNIDTRALRTTKVVAGTGLSGGGDLTTSRTLSVNFGSTAGTAVEGNDPRLNAGGGSYTAGSGITLTGTVFSLPVTTSGTGDYVSAVAQSTGGITVTKATLPTPALVTSTTAAGATNVATTNTNTFLNVTQGGASPGSSTQVTGTGSVSVASDANGKLTITGANGINGISLVGGSFKPIYGDTVNTIAEGNHTHTFASITSKPTTLGGYGITDGIVKESTPDFNKANGFKILYGASNTSFNSPLGNWANGIQFSAANNDNYFNQLVFDINGRLFARTKDNSTIGLWEEIQKGEPIYQLNTTITSSGSTLLVSTLINNYSQNGRNTIINVNSFNLNVNVNANTCSTYVKIGSGVITFTQGSGRILRLMDGTAILNGISGSTARVISDGLVDYLYITNY